MRAGTGAWAPGARARPATGTQYLPRAMVGCSRPPPQQPVLAGCTCQLYHRWLVGFFGYTKSKMESRTVRFWNIKSTHHRRVLSPAGYCPAFEPHGSPVGAVCGQTKRVSQPGEGMSPPDLGGRPAAIQIRIRACFGASIIKLAPFPSTAQLWRVRSPGKVRW